MSRQDRAKAELQRLNQDHHSDITGQLIIIGQRFQGRFIMILQNQGLQQSKPATKFSHSIGQDVECWQNSKGQMMKELRQGLKVTHMNVGKLVREV